MVIPAMCPLCSCTKTSFFRKHPDVDQNLFKCNSCALYFAFPHISYVHSQNTRVDKDAVDGYWANAESIAHYLEWREDENERLAKRALSAITPGSVLEIGVGDGPLTRRIAPKVSDYWGIEPDTDAIKRARALLPAGKGKIFPLRSDEINQAPEFANMFGKFDAVFLFSVLEHIPEPLQFFSTAKKLLKADGKLIISVPNSSYFLLFYILRKSLKIEPWTYFHISFFSSSNLFRALEKSGFSVSTINQHRLLTDDSIKYFEKRYRSRLLGLLMRAVKSMRLDTALGMTTYFLVCEHQKIITKS